MRERVGDQPLARGVRDEREADQDPPAVRARRQHLLSGGERHRQQDERSEGGRHRHHLERRRAAIAQSLHREEVPGIEQRGHHAERVAEQRRAGKSQAVLHEQRDSGERKGERAEEQRPRLLAEEEPRREGDEGGGEVGEQRRVRHRGVLDRQVPEGEVARESNPGSEKKQLGSGNAVALRSLPGQPQEPENRNGKRDAPESGRGRAGLGEAHEDRRERDEGRAEEQRGESGRHARGMLPGRYLRSFQRLSAAS